MKRVLCAILAAAMLVSFTACDPGNSDPSKVVVDANYFCNPASVSSDQYAGDIMLPNLDNAAVSVMMDIDWSYLETNENPEDPFQQLHATYIWRDVYAGQGGDVTITTISGEQQTDYLATQTASGTAPDIIPCGESTYPRWNAAGLTAAVDDYADYLELGKDGMYNTELMDQFKWGGKWHAAVTLETANKNYIVYNKTKFEQAGQSNPLELWQDGKWNWTQFVKTAKAMTTGTDFGFTGWGLFPYFVSYPMAVINDDGTASLNIDDTKYMRYMTEVYNLYQTEGAARNTGWDLQSWSTLFPAGTDAMVMTDLSGYKRVCEAAKKIDGDTFGIAPVPVFDPTGETEEIAAATLWAYSISAAAANPIGAAAYIRLERLVSGNITESLKGTTWQDLNLTDEEKAMIEETKDHPIVMDPIRGIGNCYLGIVDASIVPAFYYQATQDSVQSIFDSQKAALQAEFDEFNEMAAEAAAEAEEQANATTAAK